MPAIDDYQCCKAANLWVSDERFVCWKHASDEHRERLAAVEVHAPALGIPRLKHSTRWDTAYAWPAGPYNHLEGRERLTAWALANDLTLSAKEPCFHSLLRGRCSGVQCEYLDTRGIPSLNKAGGFRLDTSWMDHITLWERGGRPVVLVNQPYLNLTEARKFRQIGAPSPLRVEVHDESWYRQGTCFIGIWLDEPLQFLDPKPRCSGCETSRSGYWFVQRSTLEWHCYNCRRSVSVSDEMFDDKGDWWHADRAVLRKRRSLAMILRGWRDGVPPTTDSSPNN